MVTFPHHERRTVSSFFEFLPGVPDLLVDVGAVDRLAVAPERAVPRRNRFFEPADLEEQLPVMFLDHGVDLQLLRRTTIYQREILLRLARAEFDEIPRELVPFYRDVYDHFARVTELVDSYRELVTSLLEAQFSIQSNRMKIGRASCRERV